MDPQAYGYMVGIVCFLYGTIGYGLSVCSYVLETVLLRPLFSKSTVAPPPLIRAPRNRKSFTKSRSRQTHRSSDTETSESVTSNPINHPAGSMLLQPQTRLRRVSSLHSLDYSHSFILVAPAITIHHPDHIDNLSADAPTIAIPNSETRTYNTLISKQRDLALDPTPPCNVLSHDPIPIITTSRPGTAFRLSSLRPWGKERPQVLRSASSPQLNELGTHQLGSKKGERIKIEPSAKNRGRRLQQRNSTLSQSLAKNAEEKKRPQILRTRPYDAPFFVPPPVPPIPSNVVQRKVGKRGATLPPESTKRKPSWAELT